MGFKSAFVQVESSGLAQPHAGLGALSVLRCFDLEEAWRKNPPETLHTLHQIVLEDDRPEILFALAQLSYAWALELGKSEANWVESRHQYLRSAIYSWLYLFPAGAAGPSPYDVRFRDALGLYSRAVAMTFARSADPSASLDLTTTAVAPFGVALPLNLATEHFAFPLATIGEFYPSQGMLVEGLAVRNQIPGLGAPLIGRMAESPGRMVRAIGASLVLRVEGTLRDFDAGRGRLHLELRSPALGPDIAVGPRTVPVAFDLTAPMAYALGDEQVWELGFRQFFRAQGDIPNDIYLEAPHTPGKIPIVLIHGTVSSPVVWAAAINTLRADPLIRERCEFWLYIYRSGYPINYSAVELRNALQRKLAEIRKTDPSPNLDQVMLVGHSQGGLLAKLTAVEPGQVLWDAVFNAPYDPASMKPELRGLLERGFFFKPVPEVKRVVFMATPHRGSELTEWWPVTLVRGVLKAPREVLQATTTVQGAAAFDASLLRLNARGVPTSVEDMSERNPWLLALASLPLADGVHAHSIIGLRGKSQPPDGGDGVVPYRSAHVAYAESEKLVRSNHSVQQNPVAIEELRRILRLHLADLPKLAESDPPPAEIN